MYFEKLQRGSNNRNLLFDIIFVMKYFFNDLFRGAPYRLMQVLHKDALFHCNLRTPQWASVFAQTNESK
jgi:hypothetical protein